MPKIRLRRYAPRIMPIALIVGLVVALAGCAVHKGNRTADGDKAVVCRLDTDIDAAGKSAQTPTQTLAVLRSFQPRFAQALAHAPASIKPALQTMVDASRQAVRANSISAVSSSLDAIGNAGDQLDTYCGITSSSAPEK